MTDEKRIVEINGIKMEVDLREATRIDTFRVGAMVKLLIKTSYSNDMKVHPGVIAGFEEFEKLPTIIIAYVDADYSSASLKFAYVNESTKEQFEFVAAESLDLPIEKQDILSKMDRDITKKEEELRDLGAKKEYFLTHFNKYFESETAVA